jgi:hypothetical protein
MLAFQEDALHRASRNLISLDLEQIDKIIL